MSIRISVIGAAHVVVNTYPSVVKGKQIPSVKIAYRCGFEASHLQDVVINSFGFQPEDETRRHENHQKRRCEDST